MKTKKKDRNYIPILDQPIEELKKQINADKQTALNIIKTNRKEE